MKTLVLPLKDILVDLNQDVDLTALSETDLTAALNEAYRFLSPQVEVSANEGKAIITWPDGSSHLIEEAGQLYNRAGNEAKQGKYQKAVRLFEQVLERMPEHGDARRDIAMAYMELGQVEEAKTYLLQALRLNPQDAWSYVILGNIFTRQDKLGLAERYFQKAYLRKPDDLYLLNNYGALLANRGKLDEAESYWKQAIAVQPDYPNPYAGLAKIYLHQNKPELALSMLDALFGQPRSQDVRSDPLYAEARSLYLQANQQAAESMNDRLMEIVEARRRAIEEQTGYPIDMTEDSGLKVAAITELAWAHQRSRHLIKYRAELPAAVPHRIIRQLENIVRDHEVRQARRSRIFKTTAETREHARQRLDDFVPNLQKMGLRGDDIDTAVRQIVDGLALQLYNAVLDMLVEWRVFREHEAIRPSQFVSLHATYQESLPILTDPSYKRTFPRAVYNASIAMNGAQALFLDYLYEGKTDYSGAYKSANQYTTSERLFKLWKDALDVFEPGDEYVLTDEFARELKIQGWYEWQTDLTAALDQKARPEGTTNPELLKALEPSAVMYCLSALQRFEKMPTEDVRKVALEVAVIGIDGLDYSSSEKKYRLQSFPGESFSGLQLENRQDIEAYVPVGHDRRNIVNRLVVTTASTE